MENSRERILVADDHRENVRFIVDAILIPNGFQWIEARDGAEALQKALDEKPDLLLLDLQMPKMHGLQVLEALQERNVHIPVVLMTFHGSEEVAVRGFRMGARDYIIKPFTVQEMLAAIEGALIETRLRKERDALTARVMKTNQQLERRLREMRTLYAIGQSVTSVLELKELLSRVLDAALYLSPAQVVSILLVENATMSLHSVAERRREPWQPGTKEDLNQAPQAIEALQLQHAALTPPDRKAGARVFIPLQVSGRSIGVLVVQWPANGEPPTDDYIQLLTMLGGYAAIAIENARGFKRLEDVKEQEKETIRSRFQLYVAPSVVERILSDPDAVRLGGARQTVSVLFADLQGFTALSERIAPEELVEVLNHYLSLMGQTVISHEGTIDKFMGDGLMAFFNAPLPQPDHALRAAAAALNLQDEIVRFHRRLTPDLRLNLRIGLSTGDAVVGNVGTNRIMSYTAIGRTVNLARRLQEHAEPGQVLISENTLHLIYDRAEVRSLGMLQVRGQQREERVFDLVRLKP
jgi:class 3 adenylate cyclase/DNA-binding response OmpR family regulator